MPRAGPGANGECVAIKLVDELVHQVMLGPLMAERHRWFLPHLPTVKLSGISRVAEHEALEVELGGNHRGLFRLSCLPSRLSVARREK